MPRGIYQRGEIKRKPLSESTRAKIARSNTGKRHSLETIEKIRLVKAGVKYPNRKRPPEKGRTSFTRVCLFCKNEFVGSTYLPNKKFCNTKCSGMAHGELRKGKPMQYIDREKQREAARNHKGEKHHRWIKNRNEALEKHRIRGLIEVKMWRTSIFHRDDFTCQDCGERGGKLEAHHIKTWGKHPELRFEIDNGITLCRQCHLKTLYKEELFEEHYMRKLRKL